MSHNKQIEVPEELNAVARQAYETWRATCDPAEQYTNGAVRVTEAVLRWISENPRVPTDEQVTEMHQICDLEQILIAWQRCMFLKPEPEMPEEIEEMLYGRKERPDEFVTIKRTYIDKDIIEAFRIGVQKGRPK